MTAPSHALSTTMCSVLFKSVAFIPDGALLLLSWALEATQARLMMAHVHLTFPFTTNLVYTYSLFTTSCLLEHPAKVIIGLNFDTAL